jgi:hypothetical protein
MRYLLMIATNEEQLFNSSEAESTAMSAEYATYTEEVAQAGFLLGGERLRPTADATTVRVRDGEVLTSDGPFAETKEQIGGYYMVDAKDLDHAIELAAKIPGARYGSIEVRPIWEL